MPYPLPEIHTGSRRGLRFQCWCLVLSSFLLGCQAPSGEGDDSGVPNTKPPVGEQIAAKMVGPEGGSVEGSGITITVPPEALAVATQVRIALLSEKESDDLPVATVRAGESTLSLERVGSIFALTPHGTTFAKPISVVLEDNGQADVVMRLAGTAPLGEWELLPATVASDTSVVVETTGFSYYGAFRYRGQPTRCDLAYCSGGIRSCTSDDAGCWKPTSGVVSAPPADTGESYEILSRMDTVSHAVDLATQFPLRHHVLVWANYNFFRPEDTAAKRFALSFFPVDESAAPTAADVEETEAIPLLRDSLPHRGEMTFEASAVIPFDGNYIILGVGHPFSYSPQPIILYAYKDGTSARYHLREVRPILKDTTGLLEEFKAWPDLRVGWHKNIFGVKDGNNLHVLVDLQDEVSFQRPQPLIKLTIPVNELVVPPGAGPISVRTIEADHLFRVDASSDQARLLAISPVINQGTNFIALLWDEFSSEELSPDPRTTRSQFDYTAELREVRTGAVLGRRVLRTASYISAYRRRRRDCVKNEPLQETSENWLYARDANVASNALNDVAALSGGLGGVFVYAASTGPAATFYNCATPLDFDPNMQHAHLMDMKFAPGAGHELTSFSAVWSLVDYEYHTTRFAVGQASWVPTQNIQVKVYESPDGSLSVLGSTPTFGGHRILALEKVSAAQPSFRLHALDVTDTGGFVTSAPGPRPESFPRIQR